MMTAEMATEYARKLINSEVRGPGDVESAMHRLEAKTGIGRWTLWGLRYSRRKTVNAELFNQVRGAYLAYCERQLKTLQHELVLERERRGNDDFSDLVAEAETLVAKLKEAKGE